jgi:beta-lactam-binding protein with PASTA domain
MKSLRDFIFSKAMLKTILGVGIAWILIISASMLSLQLNSRPWSERSIPSVEGLMKDSAFHLLEGLDLVPIHLDSVYSSSALPGSVLEQSPSEGSMVKSGRPVYLTTFRVTPPDERISVVEGVYSRLALRLLERKGFIVIVKTEPNTVLNGKVVRIEYRGLTLSPDDRKKRGTTITMIVGEVSDSKVRVPWLKGLSLDDASRRLTGSSLSVGFVEYGDSLFTRNDTLSALVVRQFPSSSMGYVNAGTAIDLYLEKP